MKEATFSALSALHLALASDPRVLALQEIEKRLEADASVKELSLQAKEKAKRYEELLVLGHESKECKAAQKELYEAKKALDEHPLSREYSAVYLKVRLLYSEIDHLFFSPYRTKIHCGGNQNA